MNRTYTVYQVDAFTKKKFTGNPAGVVLDANGLTDEEMQMIARELNNSETAFLFNPTESGYDVCTRYFTPTTEVPICGHATIASQYIWALHGRYKNDVVSNKTGAGILPVTRLGEGADTLIKMTQGDVVFGPILNDDQQSKLLSALNLTPMDLHENAIVQIVSTGHSKVMIPLKSNKTLQALTPNNEALSKLSKEMDCNGYYAFTLDAPDEEHLVHGRMFAPAIGISEDPVTGNANGPLGAYLVHHHLVSHNGLSFTFKAIQGEAMKRPGTVTVQVDIENAAPTKVHVIGEAVVVFDTTLVL